MHAAYKRFESSNQGCEAFDLVHDIEQKLKSCDSLFVNCFFALNVALIVDHSLKSNDTIYDVTKSLRSCKSLLDTYLDFDGQDYFFSENLSSDQNIERWEVAKEGFNYFWPRTTSGNDFETSSIMAEERLNQFLTLIGEEIDLPNSMLDIGCGPGRYLYAAKKLKNCLNGCLTGVDSGENIINSNKERQLLSGISFEKMDVRVSGITNQFDFVMCNGVAHHTGVPLSELIPRHAKLVSPQGCYFIFVYGDDGLELRSWEFLQRTIGRFSKEHVEAFLSKFISPLRLQGILDHTYGVFYRTTRSQIENLLRKEFRLIKRVPGVAGLDVTEELFAEDPDFTFKAGSGNLRYLAFK